MSVRQASVSSTASNADQEHSPLDSPNGSIPALALAQVADQPGASSIKQSDSMEFNYFDEDESDDQKLTKRDLHTLNEQRRRDLIKQGYAQLMDLVPTCHPTSSGNKPSRAIILQRTTEYILYLHSQASKQKEQLEDLEKELQALRIMKDNYEQIARTHQSRTSPSSQQVPDHVKFMVFQGIADQLFQSFHPSISVTSFETLSSCIISWLEEYCKPQTLREIVLNNLRQLDATNLTAMPAQTTPRSQRTTMAGSASINCT